MKHPAIEFKQSKAGDHYFVVKAANNKILATSEMYRSSQAAEKGAASLVRHVAMTPGEEVPTGSLPPRTSAAIRLSTLKSLGIETMADVAAAIEDGRLTQGDIN